MLKGIIRYDGTGFAGWQNQRQGERTVQGVLEEALGRIAGQPIAVQGAGRTDSGVHALAQVFSCPWPHPLTRRLRHALSQILGPEIRVLALEEAPPHFNARFSAGGKRYSYALDLGKEPDPFAARYAWHMRHPIDLDLVRHLLQQIVGRHDFAGFQSAGSQMKTTVRTIYSAELRPGAIVGPPGPGDFWHIAYHGDAFLYKMVRNLTGTIVEIARGRDGFDAAFFQDCLQSPGPFLGHCAPAHGLFLVEVEYPADPAKDETPPE